MPIMIFSPVANLMHHPLAKARPYCPNLYIVPSTAHDKGQSFLLKEKQNRKETTTNKVGGLLENFSSVFSSSLHTYFVHMYSVYIGSSAMHRHRGVGDEWAGWAIAHPGFNRSVNHISTRGGRLCAPHIAAYPHRFR